MAKTPVKPRSIAHNVYCGYWNRDHKILRSCRIMCSPFIRTKTHTFSNSTLPGTLSWSQLNRPQAVPQEPLLHTLVGGLGLAVFCLVLAFA